MKPTKQQLLEEIVRLKQRIDWWNKQIVKAKADMKRWRDLYRDVKP